MSFSTWHNYGFGIRTDNLKIRSAESLAELVSMAPELEKEMMECFDDGDGYKAEIDDYLGYDDEDGNGLASLMKEVIKEREGILLTSCDDFDGNKYLLYQPGYPWEFTEKEMEMTEKKLTELYQRYFSIVTDDEILPDYLEAENGG